MPLLGLLAVRLPGAHQDHCCELSAAVIYRTLIVHTLHRHRDTTDYRYHSKAHSNTAFDYSLSREQSQLPGPLSRHPDDSLTLPLLPSLPLTLTLTLTAGSRLALISQGLELPANIKLSFYFGISCPRVCIMCPRVHILCLRVNIMCPRVCIMSPRVFIM